MVLTLSKDERLHEFSIIRTLFAEGKVFSVQPFRVTWLRLSGDGKVKDQLMISVPKAIHRKSTDRNLIRRRIREAYRLNKQVLGERLTGGDIPLAFCLTYTSKEILSYSAIQDKIILLLRRLKEECEKGT